MRDILTDICDGNGQEGDVELLEQIAQTMKDSSLCALGKTASNPVLSTIRYFRDEYDAHIRDKTCPAGVCSNLSVYSIDPEACIGCGRCAKVCPSNAASGVLKQPFTINKTVCISCGSCRDACPTGAIHTQRRD